MSIRGLWPFRQSPVASSLHISAAGITDVGKQREHNEDSVCVAEKHRLFVVADGMGGHKAGAVASQIATESIAEFFATTAREDATWPFAFDPELSIDENRIVSGIRSANRAIYEASWRNFAMHGMGTTVVAAFYASQHNKLLIAHVGDSRAYRVRKGKIELLTRDHSLYNEYQTYLPHISQAERQELPKNVITRALGMQDSVTVDLTHDIPEANDIYLLCSDGLSTMVSDESMLEIVTGHLDKSLPTLAQDLINAANNAGGEDNISVVLIRLTEDAKPDPKPKKVTTKKTSKKK